MLSLRNWTWEDEYTPKNCRGGSVVDLFKKEDMGDLGSYRHMKLLRTLGEAFCNILDGTVGTVLDKEGELSEK